VQKVKFKQILKYFFINNDHKKYIDTLELLDRKIVDLEKIVVIQAKQISNLNEAIVVHENDINEIIRSCANVVAQLRNSSDGHMDTRLPDIADDKQNKPN